MKWPHGTKGTCVATCSEYGLCHCGCGRRPKVSNGGGPNRKCGHPFIFVCGHNPDRGHRYSRSGVETERLSPLLLWLHDRYGSWRCVSGVLGVRQNTLTQIARQDTKKADPRTAKTIVDFVLVHQRPRDPLRTFELDERPYLATPAPPKPRQQRGAVVSVPAEQALVIVEKLQRRYGTVRQIALAMADHHSINADATQRTLYRITTGERARFSRRTFEQLQEFAEAG